MTFHELEHIIGRAAALKLVTALGGIEVYVPQNPSPKSEVVRAVGLVSARLLARELGGSRLVLPKARAQRRAEILALVKQGEMSRRQAALQLDLTERWVYQLVDGDADDRQQELFEDL